MQTRVRTRLSRYYFSPLASVHVPQGAASAPPQVRLRLQVAAIAGRLTEGLCGRSGSSWTLLFRLSHHRTSSPVRVAVAPCLLSELPSPTCFRRHFYNAYLDKPARHALPGCRRRPALPPQSRFRATSTRPLLPLSCRGRPVAFSTVSRSCWSLLLSLLHVTTDAIPTTDAAVLRSPS